MSRVSINRQRKIAEWESSYRAIFNAADDAIFIHDPRTGRILDVNRKGCDMYGFPAAEMRRLKVEDLSSGQPPYTQQRAVELVNKAAQGSPVLFEWQAKNRSGDLFWVEVNLKWAHLCGSEAVLAVVRDITDRKRAEEALSAVSRRLIEAQEQERTRIARDLHDDVAQRLALLAIELKQLQQSATQRPTELFARIDELHRETVELSGNVQEISHELHSSTLAYLGTVAAFRNFCRELSERQKIEIDFDSDDLPSDLPSDISLSLFRVLQEALHNAVKHSGVKHFDVQLWKTSDEVHLTVKDFGAGFDLETVRKNGGLGLTSMQERMRLVNGDLAIESQPHRGTTVHACAHFQSAAQAARAA